VERRHRRLGAATVRAIAGLPQADLVGPIPMVDGTPMGLLVPHLAPVVDGNFTATTVVDGNLTATKGELTRGTADAIGLRLRHSDRALHLSLMPEDPLEQVVFDIAEQFRCEALVATSLLGAHANMRTAFDRWTVAAIGNRMHETGVGLLLFTLTHMLRHRLLRIPAEEAIDDIIETTRGNLARIAGHALADLPKLVHDQRAYAQAALAIAEMVAQIAADATDGNGEPPDTVAGDHLLIPDGWDALDAERAATETTAALGLPTSASRYQIYDTTGDRVTSGRALYPDSSLRRLRRRLDEAKADHAVGPARIAQRLQQLFASWRPDGWASGHIDGTLDPQRLSQVVADPLHPAVLRIPWERPRAEVAVTILVDTSGSMKRQRYETAAVLVDTLARAVELAGGTSEVLGFTTASWNGGEARRRWEKAGRPPKPGRLAETLHIVYKPADLTWRQSRLSLAAMLRTDHYREGIDGEALAWAWQRLLERDEQRKLLLLLSDGMPMEASTANANGDDFLADHLLTVASTIRQDRHQTVQLGALSLTPNLDQLEAAIPRCEHADLSSVLSISTYDILARLFH